MQLELVEHNLPPGAESVHARLSQYDSALCFRWAPAVERWVLCRRIVRFGREHMVPLVRVEDREGRRVNIDGRLVEWVASQDVWRRRRISDFAAEVERAETAREAAKAAVHRNTLGVLYDQMRWAYRRDQAWRRFG